MVEKSWAVQIQRLPCCSFWPQDRGPEVVLAGFYLLVQIQTVILKERMLWVTPARLWGIQRSSSNLFFPYSCCCFLFSYLCMWPLLQLNIFLRTEAKTKVFSAWSAWHHLLLKQVVYEKYSLSHLWTHDTPWQMNQTLTQSSDNVHRKKIIQRDL